MTWAALVGARESYSMAFAVGVWPGSAQELGCLAVPSPRGVPSPCCLPVVGVPWMAASGLFAWGPGLYCYQ